MDYRRLMYFLAIVEAGTITAAAAQLRIAQPALTRQMKTLERELSLKLFEPHGNRLRLTSAGRDFLPAAQRLRAETLNAERAISTLRSGQVETLHVAATVTSIQAVLAPFIATLEDGPVLLTQAEQHFQVYDALQHGADIAVSPAPPPPEISHLPIGRIPIRAWVRHDHPWALEGRTSIRLSAMESHHVILPSHNSVSRLVCDAALTADNVTFGRISECDDSPTILALVRAGKGIGISTALTHAHLHPLDIVVRGAEPGPHIDTLVLPLQLAWAPGHYAEPIIREIGADLQHFVRTQLDMTT